MGQSFTSHTNFGVFCSEASRFADEDRVPVHGKSQISIEKPIWVSSAAHLHFYILVLPGLQADCSQLPHHWPDRIVPTSVVGCSILETLMCQPTPFPFVDLLKTEFLPSFSKALQE